MAKVVCVLYPDPIGGYPQKYVRDSIPSLQRYPDGQSLPTSEALDFTPGELVGCVSGELGLRKFVEDAGHTLVVTSDKDGEGSEFDRELADANVVISQPFWPAYDATKGSGLLGRTDRVQALGGTVAISSHPGEGTSLEVSVPVEME